MTSVLYGENFGTVTLFRVYPDAVDTWTIKERERTDSRAHDLLLAHNDYNRRIHRFLHDDAVAARGVFISMTECYQLTEYHEAIVALKVYVLSPFVDELDVELLVAKVLQARRHVPAQTPATRGGQ